MADSRQSSEEGENNQSDQPRPRHEKSKKIGTLKKIEFETKIKKIFAFNGCEHVICIDEEDKAYSFGFNQRG